MDNLTGGETFCFDTQRAEISKNLGLVVGLGNTIAYENQLIDFKKFITRHINYGKGDYDFYVHNASHWNFKRKLKSIFHIAKRYIFEYPSKTIKYKLNLLSIPYLFLIAIVRYIGWLFAILEAKFK